MCWQNGCMRFILPIIFFFSCSSQEVEEAVNTHQVFINGRDQAPLFQAAVPKNWEKIELHKQNIQDTTVPIAEWTTNESIRITIHTFPISEIRIAPMAQIGRWQKQVNPLTFESLTPQAFAGFAGFLWEGENGQKKVMAWTMHLSSAHLYSLSKRGHMQQDVTIKAQGEIHAMNRARKEILSFSRSLEFIDEL
jgi:hypothetical protein